ncbi:MAG TPA: hypothetical protein PKV16_04800 [Caldisericia bacterium]|nr:hypothetical protein [Caldisericia bacterium]HPF48630.1 hypothetical protein [Caldisericia bacterium]HPI83710.1 hypothetical protein [Caldisericia bacterium]HPQ93085.1 hypothetical protein [Caldisericia bacterium]HRV75082.1 hypothetical protein [Caldisericia bacterium]
MRKLLVVSLVLLLLAACQPDVGDVGKEETTADQDSKISQTLSDTTTTSDDKSQSLIGKTIILERENVISVIDGATIEAKIDIDESEENEELKQFTLMLSCVRCHQEYDQLCYYNAIEFTKEFLFLDQYSNKEDADKYSFYFEVLRVNGDGLWGYLFGGTEEQAEGSDDKFDYYKRANNLFDELILQELSYICMSDISEESEYILLHSSLDLLELMFELGDESYAPSIFSPTLNDGSFSITINPDESDREETGPLGDHIRIEYTSEETDEFNLTGYSIMDESKENRFFFPNITLKKDKDTGKFETLDIYTGISESAKTDWKIEETDTGYKTYICSEDRWLKPDGEMVYLRNPNREIECWVYWTGEETVSGDDLIDFIGSKIGDVGATTVFP